MADLGAIPRNVLSDGEERQTHAAPPPGNGGRVPHSGSASGSALVEGTSVRTERPVAEDRGGEPIRAGELGMVIGFQGENVIAAYTDGRTATCPPAELRMVLPPKIISAR